MNKITILELEEKQIYNELSKKVNNLNNAIDNISKLLVNQQIITKQLLETIDKQDRIIQQNSIDIQTLQFYQCLFVSLNDQQNQKIIYDQIINENFKSFIIDKINEINKKS